MTHSRQPGRDPKAQESANSKPAFGARSLAGLASLASRLPSQTTPEPAAAPRADQAEQSPLVRALSGRIVISRESKGRGGKTVVFARGIDGPQALLESLAKELRQELGTNVRALDGALAVHGALSERLAASLKKRGALRVVLGN